MIPSCTSVAGLACSVAAAWLLRPLPAARLAAFDGADPECPDNAFLSGDRVHCTCRYPGRCYERAPTGEWQQGCRSEQGSVGTLARPYMFLAACGDRCVCREAPDITGMGSFVAAESAASMKVTRQGEDVSEDARSTGGRGGSTRVVFHFSDKHWNKEFLVAASNPPAPGLEKVFFATRSPLCGVGIFTSDHLVCSKLGTEGTRDVADEVGAKLSATAAPAEIERGFGVEFEFAGREVPEDVKEHLKKKARRGFRFQLGHHIFNGVMGVAGFVSYLQNQTFDPAIVASLGDDFDQVLEQVLGLSYDVAGLEDCFVNSTRLPGLVNAPCTQDSDCALTQYCMDCDACAKSRMPAVGNRIVGGLPGAMRNFFPDLLACKGCSSRQARVCKPRPKCKAGLPAGGGACPVAPKEWSWTLDGSVSALSYGQARALGAGEREDEGAGFELVSPPLSGLKGARSAVEVLAVLRRMGIQAGPSSGMHVHVNVASGKVPGSRLSPRQIANVWVAFARFQLVIDEMLSPGRQGNRYAQRLLLLNTGEQDAMGKQVKDCPGGMSCGGAKRFFLQMHEYLTGSHTDSALDFCNAALAQPGSMKPCAERYPQQRYYALNLVPLGRLGTVEFRAHSATYDAERILRWVQFAVAFVEHFGAGAPEAAGPFLDVPAGEGFRALAQAQRTATAEELFSSLEGKISPSTKAFYEARSWERGAPGCEGTPAQAAAREDDHHEGSLARVLRSLDEQVTVSSEPGSDDDDE